VLGVLGWMREGSLTIVEDVHRIEIGRGARVPRSISTTPRRGGRC
jgi:hypothetical protein